MKTLLFLFILTLPLSAQFFPFPGPGRAGSGGGGGSGGSATFVASSSNNQSASGAGIATSASLTIGSGDLIVVFASIPSSVTVSGVTCGAANTLTAGPTLTDTTNGYRVTAWYKVNATAATSTCAATYGGGGNSVFRSISAAHYSGVSTSSTLVNNSCSDASCNTLVATTANRSAQNVTTATANTLHIAGGVDWDASVSTPSTHTAANSYNLRVDGVTEFLYDKNISSTGTYPSGNYGTASPADEYMAIYLVFSN